MNKFVESIETCPGTEDQINLEKAYRIFDGEPQTLSIVGNVQLGGDQNLQAIMNWFQIRDITPGNPSTFIEQYSEKKKAQIRENTNKQAKFSLGNSSILSRRIKLESKNIEICKKL